MIEIGASGSSSAGTGSRTARAICSRAANRGLLLAFVGCNLMTGTWLSTGGSLALLLAGLVYRMMIEERALNAALGDRYRDFATDRARLLPLHLVEVPEVVTPPQCGVTRMGRETMRRRHQRVAASGVRRPQSERLRRRQRWYFALMGVCLLLILLAWNLVRLWSTTAAVAMSVVAAVLPPIAVVIANWGDDR
jgi:hypothetical protein